MQSAERHEGALSPWRSTHGSYRIASQESHQRNESPRQRNRWRMWARWMYRQMRALMRPPPPARGGPAFGYARKSDRTDRRWSP